MADKNFTTVKVFHGKYDLLNPSRVQAQYVFYFPKGAPKMKSSYVVGEKYDDFDTSVPLECAKALRDRYEKYLYTSSLENIKEVVDYLEKNEAVEQINYYRWVLQDAAEIINKQKARIENADDMLDDLTA